MHRKCIKCIFIMQKCIGNERKCIIISFLKHTKTSNIPYLNDPTYRMDDGPWPLTPNNSRYFYKYYSPTLYFLLFFLLLKAHWWHCEYLFSQKKIDTLENIVWNIQEMLSFIATRQDISSLCCCSGFTWQSGFKFW